MPPLCKIVVVPAVVASEIRDFHHELTVSLHLTQKRVCLQILQCGEVDEPVRRKIHGQPTVEQLQTAECGIRGFRRKAAHIFEEGLEGSSTHPIKILLQLRVTTGKCRFLMPSNPCRVWN